MERRRNRSNWYLGKTTLASSLTLQSKSSIASVFKVGGDYRIVTASVTIANETSITVGHKTDVQNIFRKEAETKLVNLYPTEMRKYRIDATKFSECPKCEVNDIVIKEICGTAGYCVGGFNVGHYVPGILGYALCLDINSKRKIVGEAATPESKMTGRERLFSGNTEAIGWTKQIQIFRSKMYEIHGANINSSL